MKIPQLNLTDFEPVISVDNGIIEIGIPEQYLVKNIGSYIHRYEGLVRDSESEKIKLEDLAFCLREGGFVVKGNIRIQFRKLLGEAPILGAMYTPWITVNGSFAEDLTVNFIEGKLNISHYQLHFNCVDDHYKKLVNEFIFPYLEKEVVKGINEQLSNFNDSTIEELLLKYGKTKIQQRFSKNLNKDKIDSILGLTDKINKIQGLQHIKSKLSSKYVNVRVTKQHLWLSVVKQTQAKIF